MSLLFLDLDKNFLCLINYLYKEPERKLGWQKFDFYELDASRYF